LGYATVPDHDLCANQPESEDCKLMFHGCENDEFTTEQLEAYASEISGFPVADYDEETLQKVMRVVFCDTKMINGESIESASPADWIFWPIHPTLERFVQYKQLVDPITDYTWSGTDSEGWDLCLWGEVFGSDCRGHRADDKTHCAISMYDDDEGKFVIKHPTVHEVIMLTKPENTIKLPYIYEHFSYHHCEASGIKFKPVARTNL
jgi:hypothetical protein